MPDISGAPEVELTNGVGDIMLSPEKTRQCTGAGTTPTKIVASESTDERNGKENWSEHVKDGIEPSPAEDDEDESSDEGSDEDSSDEEEEIKAPIELIGEFLVYVRGSDWENAAKLCNMILIYEPNNPIAMQFKSVIAEKAQIEKDLAEMSSSSDEESESSDEESDDEEYPEEANPETNEDDSDDEFEPRPGSTMKNKLIFPHSDPIWKP